MSRPDNSRHLVKAAQQRAAYTRAKAVQALRTLHADGRPVTFDAVARHAGVSRSWLYTQPDLRAEIEHLRESSPAPHDRDGLKIIQPQVGHSDASTTGLYTSVSSDFKQKTVQKMIARRIATQEDQDA
ncbi:DUF6262 family protein [Arthrobacter sp. MI7-26]|uniref:DUF6262 family protein n=1 Tax=Arthrobacter sp. MI7-26 TaxID=2993653 RepID=UPI002248F89C|nr:DUF6262 family protein [Arthrobacter sp. MI7-26]MCX2750476.1 DUF6262 family protein [Arthrobacter sp. MI7-26]